MRDTRGKAGLFFGLNTSLPLVLGLLVYLTLGQDSWIAGFLGRFFPLPAFSGPPGRAAVILRNFAPDILWAYSLGFAVMALLGDSRKNRRLALLLCVCFEGTLEGLQKTGVLPGTFDPLDIALEALSTCLALLMIRIFQEAKNEKNGKNT